MLDCLEKRLDFLTSSVSSKFSALAFTGNQLLSYTTFAAIAETLHLSIKHDKLCDKVMLLQPLLKCAENCVIDESR